MDSGWCSSQEISAIWDAFGTEPLGHTLLHVPELESSESTVTLGGSPLHQLIQEQSSWKKIIIYILSYILENSGHILSMLVGILCVTMRSYKMIMYRIYFVCWNLPAYSKGLPKSPKPLASVLMTWKSNRFISAQLTSQDATTVCQGCKRWWNHWFGWDDSVFGDSNPQKKDVSAKADERLRNTRVTRNPSSCLKSFVFPRDVRTRLPTRKSRGGPLKSSKSSWPEGQWGTVGISCGLHDMVTALIRGRAVV